MLLSINSSFSLRERRLLSKEWAYGKTKILKNLIDTRIVYISVVQIFSSFRPRLVLPLNQRAKKPLLVMILNINSQFSTSSTIAYLLKNDKLIQHMPK
jgi:hypothetical protein